MSQSHFDHVAEHYDDVFKPHISGHYLQKRIRFIQSLGKASSILDFGCGTGVLAEKLKDAGYRVSGVEYSQGMLDKALERGIEGRLLQGSVIPFDDNTFDFTYSVAVFHHLETPENVQKALAEMVRVTKPGGKVLVWDHNPLNPYWKPFMKRLPQDHGDERLVSLSELRGNLKNLPVQNIQHWRLGWIPEFVPHFLMPLARTAESVLETLPLIKEISAHNVVVATKN